jgi:uncharacterized RDD family membrane protein YckC
MSDNYYEDLGVEPGASREELRAAHRQRVSELEAAREKKGVTESQLQDNREEVARVRAAWNVLSDPFQRQRYDAQLAAESESSGEVELVDDDDATASSGTQLTGWRKLLAPPPPKQTGGDNGNGKKPPQRVDRNGRPRPEPTVQLPAGMTLAEPRVRGMALLFDISILIVIFFAVSLIVPRLIQSDYQDIQDRISKTTDLKDAREDVISAEKDVANAKSASDERSANSDLDDAEKDYRDAVKDAREADVPARFLDAEQPPSPKQLQTYIDNQSDEIQTTGYITTGLTFALAMAYLVIPTARTGRTLGMRGRRIKVVRVDGSPVTWYPALSRFAVPILLALAIPSFGVVLGLGMVAWGYFDRNGQGIHDKLARTLVVDA